MPVQFFLNPSKRKQYVLVAGDALIVLLSFVAGQVLYGFLKQDPLVEMLARVRPPWLLVVVAIHLVSFYVLNLYDLRAPQRRGRRAVALGFAVGIAIAISASLLFFLSRGPTVNRFVLLLHLPLAVAGLSAWRHRFFQAMRRSGRPRRVAFLGGDPGITALERELEDSSLWDFDVAGILVEEHGDPRASARPILRCSPGGLSSLVATERIDTVVVSVTARPSPELLDAAQALRFAGVEVVDLPTFSARILGRIPVLSITSEWVLQALSAAPGLDLARNARRAVEFVAATAMILVVSPLLLLIAAVVRVGSPGPVLFRQERLGRNERPFMLFKFRTMVVDAEAESGPRWAGAADPRITAVGSFLRRTGLDELPQLFNILRGDMSFVGPRPIRRHFADLLVAKVPYYRLRFTVAPGVTGWAQIRHGYAGSMDGQREKFEYELFSLRNSSPLIDMYILLKTAQKLVMRRIGEEDSPMPPTSVETSVDPGAPDPARLPRPETVHPPLGTPSREFRTAADPDAADGPTAVPVDHAPFR